MPTCQDACHVDHAHFKAFVDQLQRDAQQQLHHQVAQDVLHAVGEDDRGEMETWELGLGSTLVAPGIFHWGSLVIAKGFLQSMKYARTHQLKSKLVRYYFDNSSLFAPGYLYTGASVREVHKSLKPQKLYQKHQCQLVNLPTKVKTTVHSSIQYLQASSS